MAPSSGAWTPFGKGLAGRVGAGSPKASRTCRAPFRAAETAPAAIPITTAAPAISPAVARNLRRPGSGSRVAVSEPAPAPPAGLDSPAPPAGLDSPAPPAGLD